MNEGFAPTPQHRGWEPYIHIPGAGLKTPPSAYVGYRVQERVDPTLAWAGNTVASHLYICISHRTCDSHYIRTKTAKSIPSLTANSLIWIILIVWYYTKTIMIKKYKQYIFKNYIMRGIPLLLSSYYIYHHLFNRNLNSLKLIFMV